MNSKKKPGSIGTIIEIPGWKARYSPELGEGRDHWSVWLPPIILEGYARLNNNKIELNPAYTGEYDRRLDK